MVSRVLFKSENMHWTTPIHIFSKLHKEFRFTMDACPLHCKEDRLAVSWRGLRVFCNPPYGPKLVPFLEKWREPKLAVYLIPARTDTAWFHEICLPFAKEIRFIRGRLKFGESKNSAPFPSMVVIFA